MVTKAGHRGGETACGAPPVAVGPAASAADVAAAAALFRAYVASLAVDLAFQGVDGEIESLPGAYVAPAGALLLARDGGAAPLGCVGMRPGPGPGRCEMKRLYVAPAGRGRGVGRALAEAAIAAAARAGHAEMLLDTLPGMTAAQALYRELGFEPVARYYATPVAGTVFMRLRLAAPGRPA